MSRENFIKGSHPTARSPSHVRADKQEAEWAERGGGNVTPGSGNGVRKGDVENYNGYWRLECKTTKCKSFPVTREMIQVIEEAALAHGEHPAIIVEFNDGEGNKEMEVAVVPTWVLDTIKRGRDD